MIQTHQHSDHAEWTWPTTGRSSSFIPPGGCPPLPGSNKVREGNLNILEPEGHGTTSLDHLAIENIGWSNSSMTLQLFGIRALVDETVLNVQICHDTRQICYLDMFHLYSVGHAMRHWPIGFMAKYWVFVKNLEKCEKCGFSRKIWKNLEKCDFFRKMGVLGISGGWLGNWWISGTLKSLCPLSASLYQHFS